MGSVRHSSRPRWLLGLALVATSSSCLLDFDSYDPRLRYAALACPAVGAEESCYEGPEETASVGACHLGTRLCSANGWGSCRDQVQPSLEVCDNDVDDDCDGQTDEDCGCQPGDLVDCYEGPSSTLEVGICSSGRRDCGNPGAACLDQVTPSLEVCGNDLDDDCDGETDEDCALTSTCFAAPPAPQEPFDAATGGAGDVIIGGSFEGSFNLGGSDLSSAGASDVFVTKFSPMGSHQWSLRWGGPDDDLSRGLGVATNGDVVVAGSYRNTSNFGATTLPTTSERRAAIWILDTNGMPQSVLFSESASGESRASDATAQGTTKAFAVGRFTSSLALGVQGATSHGGFDGFAVRFDRETLDVDWLVSAGGSGTDRVDRVELSSGDDLLVAGSFDGTADLFGADATAGGSERNAFVARLSDADGELMFLQPIVGEGHIQLRDLSAMGDDLIVVGHYEGTATFAAGDATLPAAQGVDPFVARLRASDGSVIWSRTVTDLAGFAPDIQRALAVAVDPERDRIWVSVALRGTLAIDGHEVIGASDQGDSSDDLVLWRMNGAGTTDLVLRFGDTQDQDAFALTPLLDGKLFLGMGLAGRIDFGAGPHEAALGDPKDLCIALFPAP